MSDRIRHLEEGLQAAHNEHTDQPHPLMQPALLGIKSTMGLYSAQAACPSEDRPAAQSTARHRSPSDDRSLSEDAATVQELSSHTVQVSTIQPKTKKKRNKKDTNKI